LDGPTPWDEFGGLGSGSSSVRRFISNGEKQRMARVVARRFRGEGLHKVDSKGRVSIPALFRRVIEACDPNWKEGLPPELVIVYGDSRKKYLECYTIEAIEEVDQKIGALPRGSIGRKTLERLFHGQSFPTSIDETGRLVLPAKLRQKIDISSEAYFIAAGDTFQIWNPETYEQDQAQTENWLNELPQDFDPLSFLDGGGVAS
jgi:MraZ protein